MENEKDFNERVDGINKEVGPIFAKYEISMTAKAVVLQDGTLGAEILYVSTRKKPEEKKETPLSE
jgi:hypothetical protein